MLDILDRFLNPPRYLSRQQMRQWRKEGFLVLEGLISEDQADAVNALIDTIAGGETRLAGDATIDVLDGELAGRRMRLADVDPAEMRHRVKINDLYLESDVVRQVNLHDDLVAALGDLLSGPPMICNSLNFIRGSAQDGHFDTWYMPPPTRGRMAVSSVCLEDVHPDAGPLFYYPGSHLFEPFRFPHGGIHAADADMTECFAYVRDLIEKNGLEKVVFTGRKGDVFLWHGQLLHGGLPIADRSRTRRSLVTHYWARDDVDAGRVASVGPGKFYLRREHQAA